MKRVFRLPGSRKRMDQDLEQEFQFHVEGRIEDLMARGGLTREEAEREARRRFGDEREYRRAARDFDRATLDREHRLDLMDAIRREVKHGARSLLRSPSFSVIAALTLALGLGAATTIFVLLDRVVLRPLPYPNAERLVHLGTLWPKVKAGEEYMLSKGQYFFFKKNSRSLADILMYDGNALVVPGDAQHPVERISELDVSANTFGILGIRPELGRFFGPEAELYPDGDQREGVLSYEFWQRRFGGDPKVIGTRIATEFPTGIEIVGVLPPNTSLPDAHADLWVRNHLDPNEPPRNNHTHHAIGLLRTGVSVEAAKQDLVRVQDLMNAQYPDIYSRAFLDSKGFAINVTPLRDFVLGSTITRTLWLVFAGVGFVLLIAAANVANLFLVRIDSRRRESAVRTALGAGRAHLAAHYLTESMLLALVAGAGAIAIGWTLLRVVLVVAPQSMPRLAEVSFDGRSIAFCALLSLAFGLVFGVLPLGSTATDPMMLREGGRGLTTSRRRESARRGLVLSQVALAVTLVSGAALMARSYARLRNVQPGIDPVGVQAMEVVLPFARYKQASQINTFWRELTKRVEAVPGVVRAGASADLPFSDIGGCSGILTDVVDGSAERGNCMPMTLVTPGYLEAMGVKVRGELPTWTAIGAGQGPAVVTAAFAKRFWHETPVIGRGVKPFSDQNPYSPIVGVAADIHANGLQNPPIEEVFFPIVGPPGTVPWTMRAMHFVVRAPTLGQSAVVSAVRRAIDELDRQVPIADVESMETLVAKSMAQTSFTMLLLLIASAIALLLSAVGIYGVISYIVGQRRGEIGIRIALGAQRSQVARLVVRQSLTLAVVGAVVGIGVALVSTRLLRSLLFEVSPTDPLVLVGAAVVLIGVAGMASLGPVRRAARIDPVEAMRS